MQNGQKLIKFHVLKETKNKLLKRNLLDISSFLVVIKNVQLIFHFKFQLPEISGFE